MVEMDPASDFDILEYLDHVDNVAMYRQLARRIDKYYSKATRYIKNGKITARPNWIAQEVEKRGSKGEKFWQSYKAVCRIRYVDNYKTLPIYDKEPEVYMLCQTYFSTAVTNTNISEEDRPELLDKLRSNAKQLQVLSTTRTTERDREDQIVTDIAARAGLSPSKISKAHALKESKKLGAPVVSEETGLYIADSQGYIDRYAKRPSIVRLIFMVLLLPIWSLLLLNATGVYITYGVVIFTLSLVLGPFYWLFDREDYSPIEITKTFMAAAWGYIKLILVLDMWKEEWNQWDDYMKNKE